MRSVFEGGKSSSKADGKNRGMSTSKGRVESERSITCEGGSNTIAKYGDDFGKMGTYVENPQIKVDWSKYAEHAAERMQQRGMTPRTY